MFSGAAAALRLPALPPPLPVPAASSAAAELVRDTGRLEAAAAAPPLPLPRSAALAPLPPPFFPPEKAFLLSVDSMGPACCASTAAQ